MKTSEAAENASNLNAVFLRIDGRTEATGWYMVESYFNKNKM